VSGLLAQTVEEGDVAAGPIGLLIILLLLVATFLLIRNMNRRINRLPREFPRDQEPTEDVGGKGSAQDG
jgi:hypothetical protein